MKLHRAVAASRRAEALSDCLSPAVASVVAETELEQLRAGRQRDVAVLFADVRGCTALSEALAPHDVAAFLTDFRRRAAGVIEGGIFDECIGDEVRGGAPGGTAGRHRRSGRRRSRLAGLARTGHPGPSCARARPRLHGR